MQCLALVNQLEVDTFRAAARLVPNKRQVVYDFIMKCKFKWLDNAYRPVVSLRLLRAGAPIDCLVDTGSPYTCLPNSFANRNGIVLSESPAEEFSLVGATQAWSATAEVWLTDDRGDHMLALSASTIYFCEPWVRRVNGLDNQGKPRILEEPRPFGILGLAGGLDQLKLTVWSNLRLFELEREGYDRST
jgi:hypothetical protein